MGEGEFLALAKLICDRERVLLVRGVSGVSSTEETHWLISHHISPQPGTLPYSRPRLQGALSTPSKILSRELAPSSYLPSFSVRETASRFAICCSQYPLQGEILANFSVAFPSGERKKRKIGRFNSVSKMWVNLSVVYFAFANL